MPWTDGCNMRMVISRKMDMNILANTRDLGGMIGADGRPVKKGFLIRSGQLYYADPHDLEVLKALGLKKIYDFRREIEVEEKPDPAIDGTEYSYHPILRAKAMGISREKDSNNKMISLVQKYGGEDKEFGIKHMCRIYEALVADEYSQERYSKFLHDVLAQKGAPVLWHCTAGKDRAGFASVLIQEILGVSREAIMADYLYTEECLREEVEGIFDMLSQQMDMTGWRDACYDLFTVREVYLEHLYDLLEEKFGGMDAFIRDVLKITEEEKALFRSYYLEETK